MGVRQNGSSRHYQLHFFPPFFSDDQLDVNGQPAVLWCDDQPCFCVELSKWQKHTAAAAAAQSPSPICLNAATFQSLISYMI